MDILLAFPPLGNHEHPHLGLPFLKAYLQSHGYISCQIKDYNVLIMSRIIQDLMTGSNKSLFGNPRLDISKNYAMAREVMKGNNPSDKLKSGVAMDLIARYLKIAGLYIYNNISFDPTSFSAIEKEFEKTSLEGNNNIVLRYMRDELIPDIVKLNPSMLGFSVVFASQIFYTMIICRELKKLTPSLKIVLGGPQVTLFWKAFMNSQAFVPWFDCIIREQGEVALRTLADLWIKDSGSVKDVPNLVYRDENGTVRANGITEGGNLDDIPTPDFRDEPIELYAYAKLPYQLTRGCYWGRCTFCGYRGCNSQYIEASQDKVIDDLKTLKERHGIRIFHLMDDIIKPHYLAGVSTSIIKDNLDIIYAAFLRMEDGFNQDTCKLLYNSGLRAVLFGFESANARILKLMEKGLNHEKRMRVLNNFNNAGISNYLSCIIGFPTEQRSEAYETIDFLVNNKDAYYKAYFSPFRLFSNMTEETEKYSIHDIDCNNPMRHDETGYVSLEYDYQVKEGMPIREAMEVLREARRQVDSTPPGPIYFR